MGAKQSSSVTPFSIFPTDNKSKSKRRERFALGIIDVQNDFCADGGALKVKDAERILAPINMLRYLYDDHIPTFVSKDWHAGNHMSFASTHNAKEFTDLKLRLRMEDGTYTDVEQKVWPTHCVNNTPGAELHKDLIVTNRDKIIHKGTKTNVESYSAFGDALGRKYEKTELYDWLTERKITSIILVGLATDYCVYNTAITALVLGFQVHIILSCVRGVSEDTTAKAMENMKQHGVYFYDDIDSFATINDHWFARCP